MPIRKMRPVTIEIDPRIEIVIFNIIFLDTGEIRQKRRSKEWVMKRIFQSELKTWFNNWGDCLDLLDEG